MKQKAAKSKNFQKGEGKESSHEPLVTGLSFFAKKIVKPVTKNAESSSLKHTEKNEMVEEKREEKTRKDKKVDKKKKDLGGKDGVSHYEKKNKKPHFWWSQYTSENHTQLLVTPEQPWHSQFPNFLLKLPPLSKIENNDQLPKFLALTDDIYGSLKTLFSSAYKREIEQYQHELAKNGIASDSKWLNSVINSGTWSDKIAALTLRIQESPFHNLEHFDLLIGIAEKKDLRVSFLAMEAIKDLLIHNFLPDRPLFTLDAYRPILSASALKIEHGLLLWYEDQLKQRVMRILKVLEAALNANIIHFRKQALDVLSDFLLRKPEQEQKILVLIVNKLGDHDGAVNTKVMDILKNLIKEHPAMKLVIIKEMKNFIYHPSSKIISIYHAIFLLLKIPISRKDSADIPLQLVECYISLFDKALNAGKDGSRLLSVLLKGINQTFHLLTDVSSLNKYLKVIFKLVHTAPSIAASTQALILLSYMAFSTIRNGKSGFTNAASETDAISVQNRYYTALYAKLLSDQVLFSSKHSLFLNLIYRSMKMDPSELRVAAFIKRLMILTITATAEVAAGLLFIISEVLQHRPEMKPILDLNQDYKPSEAQQQMSMGEGGNNDPGNDEDASVATTPAQKSALHVFDNYDATKRNPLYACVDQTFPKLREQELLLRHYHPSVQAFAHSLFVDPSHCIHFNGDPLEEFSLIGFLNRFAFKNPKQKVIDAISAKQKKKQEQGEIIPVNEEYLKLMQETGGDLDLEQIDPSKQFFFKYFHDRERLRSEGVLRPSRKKAREEEEDEDEDQMDEEEELDEFADKLANEMMMKDAKSRGEEFGDEDDDDDDFGEFEEDDEMEMEGEEGLEDEDDFDFDLEENDDDEDFDEEEAPSKNTKVKGQGKKRKNQFEEEELESSAIDFEDFLAEKNKKSAKEKKKRHRSKQDDYDSDDFAEPEVYRDDMDFEELESKSHKDDKRKGKKDKKRKRKNQRDGSDDDDDNEDFDDMGEDAFADASLYEDQMEENVKQYEVTSANLTPMEANSVKKSSHKHATHKGKRQKR